MTNYSIAIIVANEHRELHNLLDILLNKAGIEVSRIKVVVDGQNTIDKTNEPNQDVLNVLETFKVEYHIHPMNYDLGNLRNLVGDYCTEEWILYLDADEIPQPQLLLELKHLDLTPFDTVFLPRWNVIIDSNLAIKSEGIEWPDYQERFLRKTIKWVRPIHPIPMITTPDKQALIPAHPELALIHIKTEQGQEKRRNFYYSKEYIEKYKEIDSLKHLL